MDKEVLKQAVKTGMETSFIFPISLLEELFGHLWGHQERDPAAITARHKEWQRIYKMYRKAVLDNGNDEMREIFHKIDLM